MRLGKGLLTQANQVERLERPLQRADALCLTGISSTVARPLGSQNCGYLRSAPRLARQPTSLGQRPSLQTILAPREHSVTHGSRIRARKRTPEGELHRELEKRWGEGMSFS